MLCLAGRICAVTDHPGALDWSDHKTFRSTRCKLACCCANRVQHFFELQKFGRPCFHNCITRYNPISVRRLMFKQRMVLFNKWWMQCIDGWREMVEWKPIRRIQNKQVWSILIHNATSVQSCIHYVLTLLSSDRHFCFARTQTRNGTGDNTFCICH